MHVNSDGRWLIPTISLSFLFVRLEKPKIFVYFCKSEEILCVLKHFKGGELGKTNPVHGFRRLWDDQIPGQTK